jgi:hypothetical protein
VRRPGAEAAAPRRPIVGWLLAVFCVLVAAVVVMAVLPASLAARFLPASVSAQDFSGSLWHGSAAHLRVGGREAGALEWQLQPAALLHLGLDARLHWVQRAFVLDGRLTASGQTLKLSQLEGGGPIEDLQDLGLPAGCRGLAQVNLPELEASLAAGAPSLKSMTGTVRVDDLVLPAVGGAAPLGSYVIDLPAPDAAAGPELTGHVHDAGGPLGLDARVRYAPQTHLGTLSGTVIPRGPLPAGLQRGLNDLATLHAPDPQGRIPLDLEFTL